MSYTYKYPHFAITVDNVIFNLTNSNDIKVLLITRKNEPYKGCYALPGGFLDPEDITLEEAATRELKEETGILLYGLNEVCTLSRIDRDPRERCISVVYTKSICHEEEYPIKAGDDAATCQWVSLSDITKENLAFDHWNAILCAMNREFGNDYQINYQAFKQITKDF